MGKPRRLKRWGGWTSPNGLLTLAALAMVLCLGFVTFTVFAALTKGFSKPLPKNEVRCLTIIYV